MAIKFEKIRPDMTRWTMERRRMGNTTMREAVAVGHYVLEVFISRRRAEKMRASNLTCAECHKVGGHKATCSKSKA